MAHDTTGIWNVRAVNPDWSRAYGTTLIVKIHHHPTGDYTDGGTLVARPYCCRPYRGDVVEQQEAWLEPLPHDECVRLLRDESVGRVAVVIDDFPVVLPVNYQLVETSAVTWVAFRTRPGNVLEQAPMHAAFEIDGIDPAHKQGWSVLVRGTLHRVDPDAADFRGRFDPEPWVTEDRDAWLVIEPFAVTGRRLHPAEPGWAFNVLAYL